MKILNSNLSFKRLLTPLEKIEARAYSTDAKKVLGLSNLAIVTHSVSFPSVKEEDIGIGLPTLNQGAKAYVEFLYDNAIDTLSVEPMGIIKGEFYSPYDGSLLSKKPIVDLKLLTTDEWANILEVEEFNQIVENKDYQVVAPTTPECREYKTVQFSDDMVLYDYVLASQEKALKKAYSRFLKKIEEKNDTALKINQEFQEYKKTNDYYLRGDAIYSILAEKYDSSSFKDWQNLLHQTLFDFEDNRYSNSEKQAEIAHLEKIYDNEIDFYKFCQFVVDKQQKDFVQYASKLAQIRYEKDLGVLEKALLSGEISEEKHKYLKAKIEEYKINAQGVNIIGDKQVGYSDMDIFSNPSIFTKDEFMGAPPNLLRGSAGQDWDFKFISYEKLFNKDGSLSSGGEFLKKTM
ncbi:MAG: 4-alpha-glucanotransferase, partial [Candidatus Gastranaerophilales bacterium]|nr:4-alpha-glucanotransferase [Candidatus Gastranaerophilales bacterium]